MKKSLRTLASLALLGALAAPAFATSFYLVVPLKTAAVPPTNPADPITVSLSGAALPRAIINDPYSESLRPYLSVTGDSAFDAAAASWSLAEGALPAGLALDGATGAVAGTPTAKTASPASFTVLATYKGKSGQAVYTIEVGGKVLYVTKLSVGGGHTCAVTTAGAAVCWGINNMGQVGNNTVTNVLVPTVVSGLTTGVTDISAGTAHTCAIVGGAAKCWGDNGYGRLGNNTVMASRIPVAVSGLTSGVTSISAGDSFTCAVASGAAKCWGDNTAGQLGNGTTTYSKVPVAVSTLTSGITAVSAGYLHGCALNSGGGVLCWGWNTYGQVGNNTTTDSKVPVAVTSLASGVSSISLGFYHSCAKGSDGSAKCWGYGGYGQLGNGGTTNSKVPATITALGNSVTELNSGAHHVCAIAGGAAKCWGRNNSKQLGLGTQVDSKVPVTVPGLESGVTAIDGGLDMTCAQTSAGTKCVGNGIMGDGTTGTMQPALTEVQGV